MPKLILHSTPQSREEIEERRLLENLALTPEQRIEKMYRLMELSLMFKKGPIKEPQGKGIVLRKRK
jgi:hypothetical protein